MDSGRRFLIAIVDDDSLVRRAVGRLVTSWGLEARAFDRGQDLLDLMATDSSFAPDCVILDLEMPQLCGLTVQKALASQRPALPVIFLSAGHSPGLQEKALASGALAYLHKPVDADALIRILHAILGIERPSPGRPG